MAKLGNSDVPDGGCLKSTDGAFVQIFDKDGRCIAQDFQAGDQCDYEAGDGGSLHEDDPRVDFYQPFRVPDPRAFCPQFTCPGCGGHRLEEVMDDVTLASEIVDVGPDGDLSYSDNLSAGDSGTVDRYQCLDCGHVLPGIKDSEELSEFLLK